MPAVYLTLDALQTLCRRLNEQLPELHRRAYHQNCGVLDDAAAESLACAERLINYLAHDLKIELPAIEPAAGTGGALTIDIPPPEFRLDLPNPEFGYARELLALPVAD